MVAVESIRQDIMRGMQTQHVAVEGDGRHFEAVVVSEEFSGMSRVLRHQRVFQALGDSMRDEVIHALSIKTFTPQEWQGQTS
ncbi:MAG: BolA/IbaG family iron-sulfur metabolism protein [Pseudomonadota bacterium]